MSLIDTDELEDLQSDLPEEDMEEFNELQEKDDLTEEEEERLEVLQNKLESEDVDMFDKISNETFEGIRKAAKYGIEPDEEDKRDALHEFGNEIEDQYGRTSSEEAAKYLNEQVIGPMIDRATGFTSFAIGIKCLTESIGDEGNLES